MSFFFFQAEDGIRDIGVTGVQTCALPIWLRRRRGDVPPAGDASPPARRLPARLVVLVLDVANDLFEDVLQRNQAVNLALLIAHQRHGPRSEERRVGKECRMQGGTSADAKI